LQQNTVNTGFPAYRDGENARQAGQSRKLRNSTNGGAGTGVGALPVLSFPPCLIAAVDGIFRPGGGGSGTVSKTSGRACPNRKKSAARDRTSRSAADLGEVCLADEFILETHGLTKEFAGFFAVRDVALKVRRGSIHALIGPNGAGKTTCFNLLTKFLKPSAGQILYKGQDITAMAPADVARLGLVRSFQISAVFPHLTALENVRVALQRQHGQSFDFWRSKSVLDRFNGRAHELLNDVGLSEFASTPAVEMPYGRKRALEIATTLALDPEMMLLDEPMAGMGHEDIDKIAALIKRISAKYTILMVEHNLSVVANLSDIITVLTRGQVLAEGNYAELSKDERVKEAYLGAGHA
jgi:branched-chain amino acid transport system ATP-binding protein